MKRRGSRRQRRRSGIKRRGSGLLGTALIGAGVLIVADRLGVFGALPSFVWVVVLFAAGAAVWNADSRKPRAWPRVPVFVAIGILAVVSAGRFAGVAALGFPAMAFLLVYRSSPRRWWALLPGGVLASVALMVAAEELFPRWDASPLMFLGFAGVFTLLYVLPVERGGQRWALIPALVWIALTVLLNTAGGGPHWLLPMLLILGGVAMVLGWGRGRRPH
jgi:hypothetical protein